MMKKARITPLLLFAFCSFCAFLLTFRLTSVPVPAEGTDASLYSETDTAEQPAPLTLERIHTVSFPGMDGTDSYYDSVCYAAYTGLLRGADSPLYDPTACATCGELGFALRQLNETGPEGPAAVPAPSEEQAVSGDALEDIPPGSETFASDSLLTREKAAVLLYGYARYAGCPVSYSFRTVSYVDDLKTGDPSFGAMDWALSSGIFKPLVASRLLPQESVTRAQMAKVLVSFIAYATHEEVAVDIADRLTPASSLSSAAETEEERGPAAERIQSAVDRIAEYYGAVGVQVAVIRNGVVSDTYVYGSATKGVQEMTPDTKLRIASISKVVLGMVAVSLQEEGVIDVDADIGPYWGAAVRNPSYPDIPVTIRSILSHTSSIVMYGDSVSRTGTAIRSKLTSSSCFSRMVPGSIDSWGYNNYAFAVLGVTLEQAADETVNSIASRRFFDRLDIDASFGAANLDASRLATLYYHDGTVARTVSYQTAIAGNTYPGESGGCFAGGLTISAFDLAKLVAVLANDGVYDDQRLLSAESVALMETVFEQKVPGNSFYQGLPLRYQTDLYGQDALYYHTGSAYGVYNCISYQPDSGNGVVVLTTGASAARDDYGIYKICGEISETVYSHLAQ